MRRPQIGYWRLPAGAEVPSQLISEQTGWHSLVLYGSPANEARSMILILFFKPSKQTGPPMELIQRRRHQITRKWGLIADVPAAATPSLKSQAACACGSSELSHLAAEWDLTSGIKLVLLFIYLFIFYTTSNLFERSFNEITRLNEELW